MTNQEKFVHNTIQNLAITQGASREAASNAASEGLSRYRRDQFKNVPQLIKDMVIKAKKFSEE